GASPASAPFRRQLPLLQMWHARIYAGRGIRRSTNLRQGKARSVRGAGSIPSAGELRILLRLAGCRGAILRVITDLPSLLGVMDLAACSRAIECRDSAVDDRLSAFKTVAQITGLPAGFRGQHPYCRGLEPWNAAITHGLRDSCPLRLLGMQRRSAV